MIVDALKTKYPLPVLLKKLKMAKSSYYYQKKRLCFAEKHKDDCQIITTIFHNNKERYGYHSLPGTAEAILVKLLAIPPAGGTA